MSAQQHGLSWHVLTRQFLHLSPPEHGLRAGEMSCLCTQSPSQSPSACWLSLFKGEHTWHTAHCCQACWENFNQAAWSRISPVRR